jgi:AcrR family transcriptional regulator
MSEPGIVAAGIRLADADGLDAVSIRRVAAQFAGRPMSVYSFVESKERLVELMVDEIMGQIVLEQLPEGWRASLHAIAGRTLEVGSRHPWLIEATVRTRPTGANARQHAQQSYDAVRELGLRPEVIVPLLAAIDAYTIGFAMNRPGPSPADAGPTTRDLATFTHGLDWILDGFEREHVGRDRAP